ncbi:tRNA 2-thiouridine(34) synthase MnmA [Candidatus Kaiserbacteria bacterium CG10_big_fil_rev_8_21_14_0_10_51_14]|uniref:tRNA-specific 2-thiouridylase MnmA n=1 Tax=Candidatus Kaiserbacteria bacterium CG10_big_fil_rev_8_21_14_0_10_51_14 TaxID=1974610 RepID=A0A2H0UD33_9BACT|nr:MAG: tRNA 2-thiouridine(34) synthase MnmA [Candidatus Kaiserbacteria bacterium CG10_big_fil_rev_8_21_14_0_10_51_14]
MSKKVFVGLSGGVDSAVSAALLKEQGYDAVGVFIKIWQPEFIECTWKEDRLDAMRVCAALGIPFREVDLSEEYKKDVVESMVRDYARGVTPNPDVLCNRYIKFGSFLKWAIAEGADTIATGHYARIETWNNNDLRNRYILQRGKDSAKDQSYFLYRLNQEDLRRTLFPIGGLRKSEVREKAFRYKLPVAEKPDSQGLCFVGEVGMADFLARFIPVAPGSVYLGNEIIGEHQGAALYTLGQRHGFTSTKASAPGPYYVVATDVKKNAIQVSLRREDAARGSVLLEDVHWITGEPDFSATLLVQARYHEQPVPATLSREGKEVRVTFGNPHIASPGQSLVIYKDDVCLGGGGIRSF